MSQNTIRRQETFSINSGVSAEACNDIWPFWLQVGVQQHLIHWHFKSEKTTQHGSPDWEDFPFNPEQSSVDTYWVAAWCVTEALQYYLYSTYIAVRAGGCLTAENQWQSTGCTSQVSWVPLIAGACLCNVVVAASMPLSISQCNANSVFGSTH